MCRDKDEIARRLETNFPRLAREGYRVTSGYDPAYNCVAWAAARDTAAFWEPSTGDGKFWPADAPDTDTPEAFVALFELLGFEICDPAEDGLKAGYEKVALYWYEDEKDWSHVAYQLPSGAWSSKLGAWEDVEHETLSALFGKRPAYGTLFRTMKRKVSGPPALQTGSGAEKLKRLDALFGNVVSASNKAVQEKMKEEKRKRARKRAKR